jgi:GAF domain-containing protein
VSSVETGSRTQRTVKSARSGLDPARPLTLGFFERHGWWGWVLGISILVASVVGLLAAGLSFSWAPSFDSIGSSNQPVLMVILVLTNLLFIGYVGYQQHLVMRARRMRHHRRLQGILTISRTIGAESDPQQLLSAITEICRKTYDCDQVSLMKLDQESGTLQVCSASGHKNLEEVLASRVRVGAGVSGWVAEHRQPVILGANVDPRRFPGLQVRKHRVHSAMVVPILLRDELFGILSVSSRSRRVRYDDEDLETLLVFAETAGIVSRHAEQATWMRETIQRLDTALTERGAHKRAA